MHGIAHNNNNIINIIIMMGMKMRTREGKSERVLGIPIPNCGQQTITMTLESDRPERGSDDRHNTPTYGASGALPPFRETYLPGEARDLLPVRTHNRIRSPR
jgi:hypothetical protein